MADEKTSTDFNVEPAAEQIAEIENLEELEAFVEGDDRKGVQEAYEAAKAEFEYDPDGEDAGDAEASSPKPPSKGDSDEADSDEEDGDEAAAETVTVVSVATETIETVAQALADKNKEDRQRRATGAPPAGVDKAAVEAQKQAEALLEDHEGDELELDIAQFESIRQAVAEKVTIDQERRGLSQPAPVDQALKDAREALEEIGA